MKLKNYLVNFNNITLDHISDLDGPVCVENISGARG